MATRKTAKTSSSKSTPVKKETVENSSPKKFKLTTLILPVVIILAALLIWTFKNQFLVATVNGQPITRIQLIKELEKKDGKAVLESLITENLILQEASKKSVDVSESEVKAEISKIEKSITSQGQNLDMVLSQQNMTRDDLNKQIKLQLLLKKMVGGVTITDKEVDTYIEQNKESFPEATDASTMKPQVKSQLEQQKLGEKIQKFISEIQSKAKIEHLLPL